MAVKRIWHGWTTPENADTYERVPHNHVIPGIEAKSIPEFQHLEVLRRDLGEEVEFVTLMTFESLQSVIDVQGEDYQRCYVPEAARRVLKHRDKIADHFEVREALFHDP